MFGRRESLREFVRGENESLRDFLEGENRSTREFFQGENESLRELIRRQHEEFMRFQERREEEHRDFNRELLLRNEKVYTSAIAEAEEGRKQIQANTRAVLSVLDRLEGSGGAAA